MKRKQKMMNLIEDDVDEDKKKILKINESIKTQMMNII